MLFGIPVALFPAVADRYGGPEVLGLLYAAEPVGRDARSRSRAAGWRACAATARRSRSAPPRTARRSWRSASPDSLALALVALAAAGAADMSSGIFRQTLWNQTIPDHMRGRLAGIEQLSYSIGPTLGTARSGAVAAVTSVRVLDRLRRGRVRRRHGRALRAAAALLALRRRDERVSA